MKQSVKEQAIKLRKQGWSYNVIISKLGVAKSTLNHWLVEIPYTPNKEMQKIIKMGPIKSSQVRNKQMMDKIQKAKETSKLEIGEVSKRDLWMIGLGLYIGEGTKIYEQIRIINSDPNVIKLAMRWFREICCLDDKNFSIAVHLYPDVSINKAKHFWSNITKIPLSQFGKTQIDKRQNKSLKKQRKLPYGTVHISIKSCGNPQFGVALHRKIMGWIDAIYY
ncbi:MAG: helix-turn-helix domain-containing protein [bacterium]